MVLHIVLFLFLVYFGVSATKTDSTDKLIYFQRHYKDSSDIIDELPNEYNFKCGVCKLLTQDNSKHCG